MKKFTSNPISFHPLVPKTIITIIAACVTESYRRTHYTTGKKVNCNFLFSYLTFFEICFSKEKKESFSLFSLYLFSYASSSICSWSLRSGPDCWQTCTSLACNVSSSVPASSSAAPPSLRS